jgi:hypothetical protein
MLGSNCIQEGQPVNLVFIGACLTLKKLSRHSGVCARYGAVRLVAVRWADRCRHLIAVSYVEAKPVQSAAKSSHIGRRTAQQAYSPCARLNSSSASWCKTRI